MNAGSDVTVKDMCERISFTGVNERVNVKTVGEGKPEINSSIKLFDCAKCIS